MTPQIGITLFASLFFSLALRVEGSIFGENSCKVLVDDYDRAAMLSRNFIGGQSNRWPNGVVPYVISSSFSASQKDVIMASIKHISDRTCVKFVERTNQNNYLDIFTGGSGCYANLGYNSRRQRSVVHLQSRGCVYLGVVVHELLHILGFGHEQTRFDRDEYVKMNWNNMRDGVHSNFWRALGENEAVTIPYCGRVSIDQYDNCYAGFRASTFGIAYDYGSVMHYGLNYFTKNGQNTMSLKKTTSVRIPNRRGMSQLDVAKTRAAYQCASEETSTAVSETTTAVPETTTAVPETTTAVPETTTAVPETTTAVPETTTPACRDTWRYCSYYKNLCGRHNYINKHCKKTCFNCVCENKIYDEGCSMFEKYCSYSFVRSICLKTCKRC